MVFGKKKPAEPEPPKPPTPVETAQVGQEPDLPPKIKNALQDFETTYAGLFTQGNDFRADILFACLQELKSISETLSRIEKNG